jgi:hypothetical protein
VCSSSSLSDPFGSESIMASPRSVPDMRISAVVQDISEVTVAKAAHQAVEPVEPGALRRYL